MRHQRATRLLFLFLLASAWGLLLPASSPGDVLSIGASKDNTMYEEDGAGSNGAGDYFFAGNTKDAFARRGLLAFDIAGSIPAGSTINSVTLTLYMSRTRTQNQNILLHKVLADWGEGTSHAAGEEGAPAGATTGDATWTHRFWSTTTWTSNGGDYNATASATAVVSNQSGFYTWSSAGMVSDVQDWLDNPGNNFGWVVIGNETNTRVAKRFNSRTNSDASRRPDLTVDFTPPSPTRACCATEGTCTLVTDPGNCTGTPLDPGTVCDPNPCPQPNGACCSADALATCTEVTEESCTASGGTFEGDLTTCTPNPCPVVLTPFLDALPIPAVAQPTSGSPGAAATYDIAMREIEQQLHTELANPTRVWGYGDGPTGATFPGATIEAFKDQPVTVNWMNDLKDFDTGVNRTVHYLPVDNCPHGAGDDSPRTVVHLHGAHVAAAFDGYPEATFLPGNQVTYVYPNNQLPSTLWFHDHALGITRLNVYMGLAAFYLIRDTVEQALNLPTGEFEIPVAIQDRSFNPDGSLQYPADWEDLFFGDTMVVNGKAWPFLNVKQGKYRFRFLNGCNSRTLKLSLDNGASFQVIGQEGGLLPAPVTLTEITLGPAERADTIIDFESYAPGTEIILTNSAPAPFPGTPGVGVVPNVMKFIVQNQPGDTDAVPSTLRTLEALDEIDAVQFRTFELKKGPSDPCAPFEWEVVTTDGLNGAETGHKWVDITEYPELDTTEVWSFVNRSGMTHPMHMHLVMFQVLDRQAFEEQGGLVVPIGSPVPPPAHEAGWKDTVQVGPNEIVRVIARFEGYTGKYAYHCHILEHEDHEMMRQFQTVQCGNGIIEPGEACDDGNTTPGDCCAADCTFEGAGSSCDDGLFCNAGEVCDGAGNCGGGGPNACDDGVGCTADACDEVGDVCVNTPNDALCDDALFCNGTETCDAALDCQAGSPVDCSDGVGCTVDACNEVTDSCDNTPSNALCADPLFCNGAETCDAVNDCQAGIPVDCDDADLCTDDACNEGTDLCDNIFDPTNDPSCEPSVCGNGLVEGIEGCDDNNTSPDDGCDAACQIEAGWTCTGEPSVCSGAPIPALPLPGLVLFLLLLFGGTRLRRGRR